MANHKEILHLRKKKKNRESIYWGRDKAEQKGVRFGG